MLTGYAKLAYIAQVQEKFKHIENRKEFQDEIAGYFPYSYRPVTQFTINVIEPNKGELLRFVEQASLATDLVYGASETTVSRDSSGSMVNNATSSSRGTKIGPTLAELAKLNETWAGFDIGELHEGTSKVRDIFGAGSKSAQEATPAETTIYRYLYGFWTQFYTTSNETGKAMRSDGGGVISVHHAVNSDKSNLPAANMSLGRAIHFTGEDGTRKGESLYKLLQPSSGKFTDPDEEFRGEVPYDIPSFKKIIKERFRDTIGKINADAFNKIAKDLTLISDVLFERGVNVSLNPYSNFEELNTYLVYKTLEGRSFGEVWSDLKRHMSEAVVTLLSRGQKVELDPLAFAVHEESESVVFNPILVDEIFRYGAEGYLDYASMGLAYKKGNFFDGYKVNIGNKAYENHGRILGLQEADAYFESLDDLQITSMLKDLGNDGLHLDHPNLPPSDYVEMFRREQQKLGWADSLGRTIFAKIRYETDGEEFESKIYNTQYFSESKDSSQFITLKKYLVQQGLFSETLDPSNPAFSIREYVKALNEHYVNALRFRSMENVKGTLVRILSREGFNLDESLRREFREEYGLEEEANVEWAYLNSLTYKQLFDLLQNLEVAPDKVLVKSRNLNKDGYLAYLKEEYSVTGMANKYKDAKIEFDLEYNPAIIKFYLTDALLSEQLNTVSTGLSYNLGTRYSPSMDVREFHSFIFGQRSKRNVANSGTKMLHTRNQIDGPSNKIKLAVIEDRKAPVFNLYGDNSEGKGNVTVWDGGTFISPIQRNLERNSLRHNADGRDAKSLGSSVDENGAGVLWKAAWFALDNERIRMSRPVQVLTKMMHNEEIVGLQKMNNGEPVVDLFSKGATIYGGAFGGVGGNGNVRLKDVYVFRDGQYYVRINFKTNRETGQVSFDEIPVKVENDSITRDYENKTVVTTVRPIKSIYNVWELFGGAYSASIKDGVLTHVGDNTSWDNATLVTSFYGVPVQGDEGVRALTSQENVHAPFRDALIGHAATAGSIKRGAVNLNPSDIIYDSNGKLSTMEVINNDMGLQNNPMHYSDDDHISLMTQVVNALSARGYSVRQTDLLYEALASLTKQNNRALFDALETNNMEAFLDEFTRLAAQTLIFENKHTNTIAGAYAELIRPDYGEAVDLDKVRQNLSVPPSYMGNLFSKLASKLTDKGIKLKFNGSMLVLTPSDGIFRMRGNKLATHKSCIPVSDSIMPVGYYGDTIRSLVVEQGKEPVLRSIADIRIDEPFRIEDSNGSRIKTDFEQVITHPSQYAKVRRFMEDNPNLRIRRDVQKERELAPISHIIETVDGQVFNYWEVDTVRRGVEIFNDNEAFEFNGELKTWEDYFFEQNQEALDAICEELDIRGIVADFDGSAEQWMKRVKQESLQNSHQALSDGKGAIVTVYGQRYTIKNVEINPYEQITSEMYATDLDIDPNAQVSDIVENEFYYIERDLERLNKAISDPVLSSAYDIKLGGKINRYFIIDNPKKVSRSVVADNGLVELSCEYEQDGDIIYRVINKKRLYPVPYTLSKSGKTIIDHRVFLDKNGMEIIMTSNAIPFLNSMSYNWIQFSSDVKNDKNRQDVLLNFFVEIAKGSGYSPAVVRRLDEFISYTDIDRDLLGLSPDAKNGTIANASSVLLKYNKKGSNEALMDAVNKASQKISERNEAFYHQIEKTFESIVDAKRTGGDIKSILDKVGNSQIRRIFRNGAKKYVSFLRSLESIVSRTPAQSHQSFMPSRTVAFDKAGTNNAYVSRWQLYLQGSDYDVDKINVLGYAFRNGIYQGWSNFMDLSSIAHLEASETLPFPTGKTLHNRAKGVGFRIDLDMSIIVGKSPEGLRLTFKNSPNLIIVFNDQMEVDLSNSSFDGQPLGGDVKAVMHPLDQLSLRQFLLERGANDVSLFNYIDSPIRVNMQQPKTIEIAFANAVASIIGEQKDNELSFKSTPDNLRLLSFVIQMHNELGRNEGSDVAMNFLYDLVEKHNTTFAKNPSGITPALENFISSSALHISKNPVNLMQATTSIDDGVSAVKKEANSTKLAKQADFFDSNASASKIRQQELNLGGMDNTSIVASFMKTFEAMGHANYMLLEKYREGSATSPLFNVSILGQTRRLLANSYLKATGYRSPELEEALAEVDNVTDAYLRFSEFLTLSTDNAKDPTLVKLNADSKMIGLYLAGFTLGYDLPTLKGIITSDLGIKIRERMSDNIFYGKKASFTVTDALDSLMRGFDNAPSSTIEAIAVNVAKALGLIKATKENATIKDIYSTGRSKTTIRNLKRLRNILQSIIYSDIDAHEEIYIPSAEDVFRSKARTSEWLIRKAEESNQDSDQKQQEPAEKDLNTVNFVASMEAANWKLKKAKGINDPKYDALKREYEAQVGVFNQVKAYSSLTKARRLSELHEKIKKEEEKAKKKGVTADVTEYNKKKQEIEATITEAGFNVDQVIKDLARALRGEFEGRANQIFIDDILSHIENIEAINSAGQDVVDAFKTLDSQVQEMRAISSVIKVNQSLPNSIDEFIRYVRNFEGLLSQKSKGLKEGLTKINGKTYNDVAPFVGARPLVDFVLFAFNAEYRQSIVELYEKEKFTTNIFEVFRQNKHYMNYVQVAALLYKGMLEFSSVFRELDKISRDVIVGSMRVLANEAQSDLNKLALNYIHHKHANEFFKMFDVSEDAMSIGGERIFLGTRNGAQAFVDYMDQKVFPRLGKGDIFFAHVVSEPNANPIDASTSLNHGMSVNMLSTNPNTLPLVDSVKAAFNSVARSRNVNGITLGNSPISLATAIFLYNLIVYGNRQLRNSFTGLFTSIISEGSNHIINKYNSFMSALSRSGNEIVRLQQDDDGKYSSEQNQALYTFLAPVVSPYALSLVHKSIPFVKVINFETGKVAFLQRIKQEGDGFNDFDHMEELLGSSPSAQEIYEFTELLDSSGQKKSFEQVIKDAGWEVSDKNLFSIIDNERTSNSFFVSGKYIIEVLENGKLRIPVELANILKFPQEKRTLTVKQINARLNKLGLEDVTERTILKDDRMIKLPDLGTIISNKETCS